MPTLSKNIVISAVLAVAAAAALVVYVSRVRDQASSAQRTIQVVVATADVPAGTSVDAAIAASDFGTRTIRAGDAPSSAVTDISTMRGEVVTQELFQGDTVTTNRIGSAQGQGASYKVTGPYRLIRVPLFQTQGLLGDVQVGDRVDVFAKTTNADETRDYESLVVRGALVLSVDSGNVSDSGSSSGSSGQGSLLLSMTEQQAGMVAAVLAGDSGGNSDNNLWLVLDPRTGSTFQKVAPIPVSSR